MKFKKRTEMHSKCNWCFGGSEAVRQQISYALLDRFYDKTRRQKTAYVNGCVVFAAGKNKH